SAGDAGGGIVPNSRRDDRQYVWRYPSRLPQLQAPQLSWPNIQQLFHPALTIALLAAIESLLCAVVAAGMVDDRHDSNPGLMAQGLANIVSPFFGGIAATGAIARTAINVKSGARTP